MKNKILFSLDFKLGNFSEEDLETYGKHTNLCDGFLFLSLRKIDNKSIRFQMETQDGISNKPFSSSDLFEIWCHLGKIIQSDSEGLSSTEIEILKWPLDWLICLQTGVKNENIN